MKKKNVKTMLKKLRMGLFPTAGEDGGGTGNPNNLEDDEDEFAAFNEDMEIPDVPEEMPPADADVLGNADNENSNETQGPSTSSRTTGPTQTQSTPDIAHAVTIVRAPSPSEFPSLEEQLEMEEALAAEMELERTMAMEMEM